jgi:hypothetical protein
MALCLNGHEWAKQRLRRERLSFDSLDNGFLSCRRPSRLQEICDALAAADVQAFFDRWSRILPWPLTLKNRAAGFSHRLSLWQVEVSLTQVFDRPVQGRHFFEEMIRENLDLGRPDRVSLIFPTPVTRRTPPPNFGYRTRIITDGVNPRDFGLAKDLSNLDARRSIGHQVNARLLEAERVSQNCVLDQAAFDRLQRPSLDESGLRAPALRFGDARVMALFQAVCRFAHLPEGLTSVAPDPIATRSQTTDSKSPSSAQGCTSVSSDQPGPVLCPKPPAAHATYRPRQPRNRDPENLPNANLGTAS